MYKPENHVSTFFIAGFQHHDGAKVLSKLKPGKKLTLEAQPDNPYDPCAVAIKRKGVMLGFVPAQKNGLPSVLLNNGHDNVLECRILQVDKHAAPWEQVRVGLYITDATKIEAKAS